MAVELEFFLQQDLGYTIHSLTQSPTTGYYFAGCINGKIFRSADGGSTWTLKSSADGTTIFAMCCTDNGYIVAATHDGRIYYSTNDGDSFGGTGNVWKGAPTGGDEIRDMDCVGNRIYIVGNVLSGYDCVVFYSDDYGYSWTKMADLGVDKGGICAVVTVVSQSELYVASASLPKSLFKWNGVSFQDITDPLYSIYEGVACITIGPDDNIYAGKESGNLVRVKPTTGGSWTTLTGAILPVTVDVFQVIYHNGNIYVATDSSNGRIYITDTEGSEYENAYVFPSATAVRAILLDDPNLIFLAGADQKIYKAAVPAIVTNPLGLTATPGLNQITLAWEDVQGAAQYNVYWSLSSDVTQDTGQLLSDVSSGYVFETEHYVPHYFVVTAIVDGEESIDSNIAGATPLSILPHTSRLLEQYIPRVNINKLLNTTVVNRMDALEEVLPVLYNRLNIDSSSGVQLDKIGIIVDQARLGHNDAQYRMLLKAKIGTNNSQATTETVISIWKIMTQASFVWVQEVYPGQLNIFTDVALPEEIQDLALLLIQKVVGAGIKVGNIAVYNPDDFGFGEMFSGFGANWATIL